MPSLQVTLPSAKDGQKKKWTFLPIEYAFLLSVIRGYATALLYFFELDLFAPRWWVGKAWTHSGQSVKHCFTSIEVWTEKGTRGLTMLWWPLLVSQTRVCSVGLWLTSQSPRPVSSGRRRLLSDQSELLTQEANISLRPCSPLHCLLACLLSSTSTGGTRIHKRSVSRCSEISEDTVHSDGGGGELQNLGTLSKWRVASGEWPFCMCALLFCYLQFVSSSINCLLIIA